MRVLVFGATTRYVDPWHPFMQTSAALAELAREEGFDTEVRPDEPDAFADLDAFDLVVINSGGAIPGPAPELTSEWAQAHSQLGDWIRAGRPVLATHTAANTFPDWPEWPELLGGAWVRGTSMHPQRSIACFQAAPGADRHPIFDGIGGLSGVPGADGPCVLTYDERYSDMLVHEGTQELIGHELNEAWQVMGWVRGRVLYDGMGHDLRAYESEARRRLVRNELRWLLSGQFIPVQAS